MVAKTFFVICASVLLVKTISAQCIGYGNAGILGAEIAAAELAANFGGCGCGQAYRTGPSYIASANGGSFGVSSSSPFAPSGISVISNNAIEGALEVYGQLPLLAAIALEGNLPSSGAAGVNYGCGNGNIGISAESLAAAGLNGAGYGNAGLNAVGIGNSYYGNAGLNNALIGAELAGINAGLAGGRLVAPNSGCGCNNIYY